MPSPFLFSLFMYNKIQKIVSAIKNDVLGGLRGFHNNISISDEVIEQDVVDTRLQLIKEYSLKGLLPYNDLMVSINCIQTDCDNIEKCSCLGTPCSDNKVVHFEIPQTLEIQYIGATDKQLPFVIYTTPLAFRNHQYRKRGKNRPYVWVDTTPNKNNLYDCYVFNAPLLKQVSIIAVFKDPRQLDGFNCCEENDNINYIDAEIKKRVTENKIRYYRQLQNNLNSNNQQYT